MKTHFSLLLILLAPGCGNPSSDFQEGRYSTSGHASSTHGRVHITTVSGYRLGPSGEIVGPLEHVLYFAIALTEPHAGSSGQSDSGTRRSVWSIGVLSKSGGGIHVEITWDRTTDVVMIEGKRFDRAAGNVFLIETDGKGNPVYRQNSKVRSERIPEGGEARVIKEEFPHLEPALKTFP